VPTPFSDGAAGALSRYPQADEDVPLLEEALERLDDALAAEQALTEVGVSRVLRYVDSHLHRLSLLTQDRRRYPEIASVDVASPVVITGAPRSGTTFLHSLMSQDPQFRSPLAWEVELPSPPPEGAHLFDDPRVEGWVQLQSGPNAVHSKSLQNAELVKKHLMGPTLPEECGSLLGTLLRNPTGVWALARTPKYFDWVLGTQMDAAYGVHRRWLQHFQWRAPRPHWLLKYPQHILAVNALVAAYPDVRIVQTHRRPEETVSSVASLVGSLRKGALEPDDQLELGREMLELQATAQEQSMAYRDAPGAKSIVDIGYLRLLQDPMGAIGSIYDRLGLKLSDDAERRMNTFLRETPQDKHGVHRHNLEQYGLTEEAVQTRMAPYYARFGHLLRG
jgi:predicted outer membrane lipoprotein